MPCVSATEPGPEPGGAPRARLLVIDDDELSATAIERSLCGQHEVVCARSAEMALDLIGSGGHFDLILCDLMMPDMTGMDFYDALEASHPDRAGRIIFLTGGAFTVRARDFLDRVPNLCIEKPFDVPQLRAVVSANLR